MQHLLWAVVTIAVAGSMHAQPAFEVASIRPTAPGANGPRSIQYSAGGRFTAASVSLKSLLEEAYAIRDFQISGGPGWINSDRFDIAAKAEDNAGKDQVRIMLQALLADRFKLTLHRELKDTSVYTLVVGKNGSKLKEVTFDQTNSNRGMRFRGLGRIAGIMASMPQLAVFLSDIKLNGKSILDRPVLEPD